MQASRTDYDTQSRTAFSIGSCIESAPPFHDPNPTREAVSKLAGKTSVVPDKGLSTGSTLRLFDGEVSGGPGLIRHRYACLYGLAGLHVCRYPHVDLEYG